MDKIVSYFKDNVSKFKLSILLVVILLILSSMLGIVLPYLNGQFLDLLILRPQMDEIVNFVIAIIVLGFSSLLISYCYNICNYRVLIKIINSAKIHVIEHIYKMPYFISQKYNAVYLHQRISGDLTTVFSFFLNSVISTVFQIISCAIILLLIFRISSFIGVIFILYMPLYILIYKMMKAKLYNYSLANKESQNLYSSQITTQLQMLQEVKIRAEYNKSLNKITSSFQDYFLKAIRLSKLTNSYMSFEGLLSLIFRSIILLISAAKIIAGSMTIGEFTIINSYYGIIAQYIKSLFDFGKSYQDMKVSFDRIDDLYKVESEHNGVIELTKSME